MIARFQWFRTLVGGRIVRRVSQVVAQSPLVHCGLVMRDTQNKSIWLGEIMNTSGPEAVKTFDVAEI